MGVLSVGCVVVWGGVVCEGVGGVLLGGVVCW